MSDRGILLRPTLYDASMTCADCGKMSYRSPCSCGSTRRVKGQTRRVVKPQPKPGWEDPVQALDTGGGQCDPFGWVLVAQQPPENPTADTRPTIVCLCGSTRFMEAFFAAGWELTLLGQIVLSVGVCKHVGPGGHGAEAISQECADRLDELHLRKIDLADWVLVLNVAGYIGDSTRREKEYAETIGKRVVLLTEWENPDGIPGEVAWETWDEVGALTREAAR